jgi:hypothetical protein
MALANDDDLIKTFPSNRADQPLAYPFCQGERAEASSSQYESMLIDWPGDPGKPTWDE